MSDDPWEFQHNLKPSWTVDSDTRQNRMDLCKSCENLTILRTCSKCNCFMPAKVWLAFSKCPIDKWQMAGPIPEDFLDAIRQQEKPNE